MSLPSVPQLSLSYSALVQWAFCERLWWLARVGAWQGWPGGTAERTGLGTLTQAADAYRQKHLLSPDQAVGIEVHALAAEVARAIRDARRPPPHAWLHERLRARMNDLWRRERAVFVANPKTRMIAEHFYGWPLPADVFATVKAKVGSAMRRLVESDALADLREAGRGEILCADALDAVPFTAPALPSGPLTVPLYAAPDVVFLSQRRSVSVEGVRFSPPVPQIIDWKCSSRPERRRQSEVARQLAVYAIYVRERFGVPPHPRAGYVGRIVDLSPRGDPDAFYLIGPRELAAARAWLEAGLTDIAGRPVDARGVIAKDATRLREDRTRCARCALVAACRQDVADWRDVPSAMR